jgi:hypothetical protein
MISGSVALPSLLLPVHLPPFVFAFGFLCQSCRAPPAGLARDYRANGTNYAACMEGEKGIEGNMYTVETYTVVEGLGSIGLKSSAEIYCRNEAG